MLKLDAQCGLSSPAASPLEFDSQLEQNFFERWGGLARDGWHLTRESEILHLGQTVFMPDFVLTHDSGRKVLLEIVGFWTPEYLKQKQATLHKFRDQRTLLAVADSAKHSFDSADGSVLVFKRAIKIEAVLERLARWSFPADGPVG